jgi:glutamyl-tRNA synthetase
MLRFASSPTGDMHIGNLRVALFNYLIAQQRGEDLIVRIDDTDKEKVIDGKDQEIAEILGLFQIEYTQVIHQSQNIKFHSAMALQLLHEKKAFSCFCSDEWIEKKQDEAKKANKAYSYDDACRNLPAELVIDNTAPFCIRIVRPDSKITIHDKIYGNVSYNPDTVDSFVILHQDKTPTYDFASAIDDMLNDISLVIRSEEYLNNTPKQIHIRDQLGYNKEIEYAHIPDIINAQNVTIKDLLEQGFLPEAISNYLISIGNSTPKEIFTLKEAKEWFTLDTINNTAQDFDIERLKYLNREHMKIMEATELSRYVGFADAEIGELAKIYLDKVSTTRELKEKIAPIFEERVVPASLKKEIAIIKEAIVKAPYFDEYIDFKNFIIKESAIKEENFEEPLRVLLTNTQDGPEIEKIYKYLKNYIGEIIK